MLNSDPPGKQSHSSALNHKANNSRNDADKIISYLTLSFFFFSVRRSGTSEDVCWDITSDICALVIVLKRREKDKQRLKVLPTVKIAAMLVKNPWSNNVRSLSFRVMVYDYFPNPIKKRGLSNFRLSSVGNLHRSDFLLFQSTKKQNMRY